MQDVQGFIVQIVNATPHDLHMLHGGTVTTLPRSEYLARAEEVRTQVNVFNGFPVYAMSFGGLTGLPEPQDGVLYVVSLLACQAGAAAGRFDLIGVTDMVRDDAGRIVGAQAFACMP